MEVRFLRATQLGLPCAAPVCTPARAPPRAGTQSRSSPARSRAAQVVAASPWLGGRAHLHRCYPQPLPRSSGGYRPLPDRIADVRRCARWRS